MKLLFDEGLSYKLVHALNDLFPGSESALRNGLAGSGDVRILKYAMAGEFVLVSTDTDFQILAKRFPEALIVILQSCNYPTTVAADVLRRNAIRIAALPNLRERLLLPDKQ